MLALLGLWSAPRACATDITSCPVTIDTPGDYHVTHDLNCPSDGTAIEIDIGNVHLSLDGHTITGAGSVASEAILIRGDDCSVSNGSIIGFGYGVDLAGNGNSVSGLTTTRCGYGVNLAGNGNSVSGLTSTSGGWGVLVGGGSNAITGNTAGYPYIIRGPSQADPHLDSIFVEHGPVFQEAILHGRGFADVQGTSFVTLGGMQVPVLDWTDDAIAVVIYPTAWSQAGLALNATYPVQVVILANGNKSNMVDFFLADGPPPQY